MAETVIALVVFSLIMASLAAVFIGSVKGVGQLRDRQQAATLAAQALEIARSVQAAPDVNGCPKLVQGRTQAAVTAQWAAAPSVLDLSTSDSAWMPPACSGSVILPLRGLARVAGGTPIDPVPLAGENYTVNTYVGTCAILVAGGPCLPAAGLSGRLASLYRVVASVSWGPASCGSACTYSAATLIDPSTDPLFNARNTVPGPPVNLTAVPGDGSAVMAWAAPTTNVDVPVLSYTLTATPVGGGSAATCTVGAPLTTCTLSGLTNGVTYSATVTATSSYSSGSASSAAQFIPYPSAVMSAARMVLWLDGADSTTILAACGGAPATTTVGCWKDKSVLADNAVQSTAGNQPGLTAVAGRNVPAFNGSTSYLDLTPVKLPVGIVSSATFAVATMTDPAPGTGSHRSVLNFGAVAAGQERELQKEAGTSNVRGAFGSSGILTQAQWNATPTVVAGQWTTSSLNVWVSGTTGVSASVTPPATGVTYAHVGAFGTAPSQFWYGAVPEVIVLNTTVTAAERRSVEEYLARKWGSAIAPAAPTAVAASATGTSTGTVSFTPGYTGGSPITSYTVVATPASGPVVTVTGCAGSPCAITGLSAGTTYSVTVAAVNAIGASAASASSSLTTSIVGPGAPTGVTVTAGDTTAAVSWTAPAVGTGITGYTVSAIPSAGNGYASAATKTCSTTGALSCTVSGLVNGLLYSVSVTATNAGGTGPASGPVTVRPYPAALLVAANVGGWWDATDSSRFLNASGTSASTGQPVATWQDRSGHAVDVTQATALNRGIVASINGLPAWLSTATTWLTSSSTGTFRDVFSVADPSRLVLFGTVFASSANTDTSQRMLNGYLPGSTGSGYTANVNDWHYTSSPGIWTNSLSQGPPSTSGASIYVSDAASSKTATVSIGTSFMSRALVGPIGEVVATNRVFTPAERRTVEEYLGRKWLVNVTPSAPTGLSATAGATSAPVSFTPGWDGGSAATSYTVVAVPTSGPTVTLSGCTGSPCTVSGLVQAMNYSVTVSAVNAIGAGSASSALSVTTSSPPGAPTALAATPGDASIALSWTAPGSTGGGITGYTATGIAGDGSGSVTCTSATTGCSLTGLTNGVAYAVTVTASSAAGSGPASASVSATPYPAGVMTSGATALWLDGADSTTLLASSGCTGAIATTTIGCWKDKSANANHATQSWWWNQATLSSLNGRTAASFDGSSDEFALNVAKLPTGTNPSAVYVVAVQEDGLPTWSCYRHVIAWGSAGTGQGRAVHKGCSTAAAYLDTYNTSSSMSPTKSWTTNATAIFDGTVTSTGVTAAMNATTSYTYSGSANTGNLSGAKLGTSPWSAGYWDGRIAEVIVLAANPSAAQNRLVEEYLAHKWGGAITSPAPGSLTTAPNGTGSVRVTWAAPTWSGGSAVSDYTVQYRLLGAAGWTTWSHAASTATSATLGGLTSGATYEVQVSTVNGAGTGQASAVVQTSAPTVVLLAPAPFSRAGVQS